MNGLTPKEVEEIEKQSLKEEMSNVIEEARMILPGIQALFGFQTIAVFNNRFEDLSDAVKLVYLGGLALLTVSMALLMTPAAYNRIAERGQASRRMVNLSSRLITAGLVPLMLAFAVDIFVVAQMALDNLVVAIAAGVATVVVLAGLWFAFPLLRRSAVPHLKGRQHKN
ncbi:MAG: DUF6328 family protein [Gammaproteobacteria bacterium]